MAGNGLKNLRDFSIYAYAENIIDDTEFFLIYDYAFSKEIYPYKHFDRFNLENFDCLAGIKLNCV